MRPFIAAALFLLLASCTTMHDAISWPSAPPPPDPKTLMPALEQRIAVLVAQARAQIDPKARALVVDPELSDVARKRVADMAAKNYLAHVSPNGDTSATLLMAEDAQFQGMIGENIAAQHYSPAIGIDVEALAQRFVATWLASQPHKDNLSFADYDHTGIGAAVNGDTVYVMQLFSTDLGLGPHKGDPRPSVATPVPDARAGKDATPPPDVGLRGSEGGH